MPTRRWSPGRARRLRSLARLFFRVSARISVEGHRNVPAEGGAVLVFNHRSNFDAHLIFSLLQRTDVTGLVAAEYQENPVTRWLVEVGGGSWIGRNGGGFSAFRSALRLLEAGWIVGIAPEGRRSPDCRLLPGKPGPAYLAIRAGVPLLPVALAGTEEIARGFGRITRPEVRVRFGAPFPPMGSDPHEVTREIMDRISGLLSQASDRE